MVVYLNVGGVYFMTSEETLRLSSSFFAGLVSVTSSEAAELFVDRDPTHFRHVLNWMRGVRYLPDDDSVLAELWWEADFYSLDEMKSEIEKHPRQQSVAQILNRIADEVRTR